MPNLNKNAHPLKSDTTQQKNVTVVHSRNVPKRLEIGLLVLCKLFLDGFLPQHLLSSALLKDLKLLNIFKFHIEGEGQFIQLAIR